MESKTAIGVLVIVGCFVLLPVSWYLGKDGTITTAVFGLLGVTAGTLLGFNFGQKNQ